MTTLDFENDNDNSKSLFLAFLPCQKNKTIVRYTNQFTNVPQMDQAMAANVQTRTFLWHNNAFALHDIIWQNKKTTKEHA